jgi:hypothetical protein
MVFRADPKRLGDLDGWTDTVPAQVVLRPHTRRGHLVFPKSVTTPRVPERFDRFDSELESVDSVRLSALHQGKSGRIGLNLEASAYLLSNGQSLLPLDGTRTKSSHGVAPSSNAIDFPRRPTLISKAKTLVLISAHAWAYPVFCSSNDAQSDKPRVALNDRNRLEQLRRYPLGLCDNEGAVTGRLLSG